MIFQVVNHNFCLLVQNKLIIIIRLIKFEVRYRGSSANLLGNYFFHLPSAYNQVFFKIGILAWETRARWAHFVKDKYVHFNRHPFHFYPSLNALNWYFLLGKPIGDTLLATFYWQHLIEIKMPHRGPLRYYCE